MKCRHSVYIDGAGPLYNDLVCKQCGHRILWEDRLRYFLHLLIRDIRPIRAGERFYDDGVR